MERTRRIEERLNHRLAISKELEPPWVRFPGIEQGSIGWRMGAGEDWLVLFWHFVRTRLEGASGLVGYLHRHPPAPRRWHDTLVDLLASLDGVNGADPHERARLSSVVHSEGLTGDDAAYPVFVRNELHEGHLLAPWTRWDFAPAEALRYASRELGFWARWLAEGCGDRSRWLAAQPPAPTAWAPVSEAISTGRAGDPWGDLTRGALPLTVALGGHGGLTPPWLSGHRAFAEIDWELEADSRHGWAWWVSSVFDDAASFRAYLERWPPPPSWDEALRLELFPWLFQQPAT
jgi:hypothetical protein